MNYYFVHEYKGNTYYVPYVEPPEKQKLLNIEWYGYGHGINKLLIKDAQGNVTQLLSDSIIALNIK